MIDVTAGGDAQPERDQVHARPAVRSEGAAQTFRAGSDPAESPLGARIFALDGVTNVFMTANFVSVTKEDDVAWDELVPLVIAELEAHFGEAAMSPTGVIFSYLIGLIFAVGGVLFLIGLDDNRFLYGIPYLLIGLVIIGGVAASQRRVRRKAPRARTAAPPSGRGKQSPY